MLFEEPTPSTKSNLHLLNVVKKTFHFDFSLTPLRGNWDRAFSYPTSPLFLGVAQTIVGCRYICWGRGIMWSLFNLLYHLILWLNNQNLRHQDHVHIHFQDKGGPRRGICMFPVCISNNMVVCTLRSRPGPSCSKGGWYYPPGPSCSNVG